MVAAGPAPTAGWPRILIVRVGAMGDVLHGLPAVAALRSAMPNALLGWAIEPRWSSLLQAAPDAVPGTPAMPLVDRLHPVETRLWSSRPLSFDTVRSILRLRSAMRRQGYSIAVDLQGSIRSAVIARLSGASILVGSACPREHAAQHFYTHRIDVRHAHVVEQAAEMTTAALQFHAPGMHALQPAPVELPVDRDAEAWCDRLVAGENRKIVFVAPTAGWGAKEWPAERYGQLAAKLQAAGFRVMVNAVGQNDPVAAKVVAASVSAPPERVSSTLPQLTALLRRVALVVAGDTGPLHLAAALDRPVVALFGPTDPARNGPYGCPSIVLRDPESVTDHRRHAETEPGLLRMDVDTVIAAALKMLDDPYLKDGSMNTRRT